MPSTRSPGLHRLVAYGADVRYTDKLLAIDERLRLSEARSTWVRGIASAAQVIASGLAVVGALLIGGAQVVDGTLGAGMVAWMHQVVFINQPVPPDFSMTATLLAVLVLTPLALHEALSTLVQAAQTQTGLGRLWPESRPFSTPNPSDAATCRP